MNRTFPIAPATQSAHTTMHVLMAMVIALCSIPLFFAPGFVKALIAAMEIIPIGLLARVVLRMDKVTFAVNAYGLDIQGDLGNRQIKRSVLNIAAARRLDRGAYEEIRPVLKLSGVGAPGYLSGWFRLRGGEKAYIYVTDKDKAVYVPTAEGYVLVLTPDDPDGFLAALRA